MKRNDGGDPGARADGNVLSQIAETVWDVVVVGAGVGGALAAALLAMRGQRVLLVEQSPWPREKVCGGCLNALAAHNLRQAGCGSVMARAQPLDRVIWQVGQRQLQIATPGSYAISRSELDAGIVADAVAHGCTFLPGVSATLEPITSAAAHRTILLRAGGERVPIQSSIVLACDGIGGTVLAGESWAQWQVAPNAWIGVATICQSWPDELPTGAIHMHVGTGGYVGLVRLLDRRIHLAAALDPAACRQAGGPACLIGQVLNSCRRTVPPELSSARFHGTGLLTRRRPLVGGHRVLVVGDACGYIEPFTGEGMAWALRSARAVADLLPPPRALWPSDLLARWQDYQRAVVLRHQRWCRGLQPMMHHPTLAAAAITMGRFVPALAALVSRRVGGM